MMAAQNSSILDDFVGAFVSVGRSILAIFVAVIGLVLGLGLIAVAAVCWLVFWLAYKLRLSQHSPRVRFQRIQAALAAKFVAYKLKKSGMVPPGGANVDIADLLSQFQAAQNAQSKQAGRPNAAAMPTERKPKSEKGTQTVVEARSEDDDEPPEVAPEEVDEFHGPIEEYVRRKRG